MMRMHFISASVSARSSIALPAKYGIATVEPPNRSPIITDRTTRTAEPLRYEKRRFNDLAFM